MDPVVKMRDVLCFTRAQNVSQIITVLRRDHISMNDHFKCFVDDILKQKASACMIMVCTRDVDC